MPGDLRVATFECAFCHGVLQTAAFAGRAAVSADALVGHLQTAVGDPSTAAATAQHAPRFHGGSTESRPASCRHCGATIAVPLDLEVRELGCGSCHRTQPVSDYVSDAERFQLDMARQVAGNEALKRLQAEGVPCGRCGGRNRVPEDGSVQIVCSFCGAAILLSEHVDASAIARNRLKHGVFDLRDQLVRAQQERERRVRNVIIALVVTAIVVSIGIKLLVG